MTEIRDRKIAVMVRPSLFDLLDSLACQRAGRHSVSSAANDILEFYFARYGAKLPNNGAGTPGRGDDGQDTSL